MRARQKRAERSAQSRQCGDGIPLYENRYRAELRRAFWSNVGYLAIRVGAIVLAFALTLLVETALNAAQDAIGELADSTLALLIVFVIVSALIDRGEQVIWKDMPDVLDGFKTIGQSAHAIAHLSLNRRPAVYVNKKNIGKDLSESGADPTTPSADFFPSYEKYKKMKADSCEYRDSERSSGIFAQSDTLPIVEPDNGSGESRIIDYMVATGVDIGVAYESPYNRLVVDLIDGGEGRCYPYERVVPVNNGSAAVIVPRIGDRFVLLRQFRYAIRSEQLAFPRGFGESVDGRELEAAENAKKELAEELGAEQVGEPRFLGVVHPDSGLSASKASVFEIEIGSYSIERGNEGIFSAMEVSRGELHDLIRAGEITDGFTLAALFLLEERGQES